MKPRHIALRRRWAGLALGLLVGTAALPATTAQAAPSPTIAEYPISVLAKPADMKSGPDGGMWFTELTGNAIGRIDPETKQVTEFEVPVPGCVPYAVNGGPGYAIWFTAVGRLCNAIGRLDLTTHRIELFTIPTLQAHPADLKVGPDGGLWFTELVGNKIARFDPVTHRFEEYPLPRLAALPQDIAVIDDGGVWFSEQGSNRLSRVDVTTHRITSFPYPTPASQVLDIDPGPTGKDIWFAQIVGNQVGVFDPSTQTFTEYGGASLAAAPFTISAGPDGAMWFTEIAGGRIGRIDPSTGQVTEYPTPSLASAPADISCQRPTENPQFGACIPGGSLYFSELGADQVGVLTPRSGRGGDCPVTAPLDTLSVERDAAGRTCPRGPDRRRRRWMEDP